MALAMAVSQSGERTSITLALRGTWECQPRQRIPCPGPEVVSGKTLFRV